MKLSPFYLRRAETLLASWRGTAENRALLERHFARAKELVAKSEHTYTDEQALQTFIEIVCALAPRLQSLRSRATAPARAAKALKTGSNQLNAIIAEETQPGLKRKDILERVNARWEKLGGSKISVEALCGRQKSLASV
jgi:hypothetical protein